MARRVSDEKGPGVRKVLVCGAAFAATCISAVAVSGAAGAAPPVPSPGSSSPASPGQGEGPGTQAPSGSPGSSGPSSTAQAGNGQSSAPDPVVSTRAVMVTPKLPRTATYAYGVHPRQRIDVYWQDTTPEGRDDDAGAATRQARGTAPTPAVLLFHGGSWIGGDKSGWKYFARRLTAQGYTVFAANYRLATQAPWPAQRDDAMAALTYVKRHAVKWNIDPDRVAVMGSSAGGLLASQLATYGEGGTRVRGAVSLSPVNIPYLAYQAGEKPDATKSQRSLRRAVVKLLGCVPVETDPDCMAQAEDTNTISHVSPGDAPMLLLHYKDEFVPPAQSTGLAAALRGVGLDASVKVYPGRQHATALLNEETAVPLIISWLKQRTAP